MCFGTTETPALSKENLVGEAANTIWGKKMVKNGDSATLRPLASVIGESKETIVVPDDCVGFVCASTTAAQAGLVVNRPPLHPGFQGKVELPIINLSGVHILLSPGEVICVVIFVECVAMDIEESAEESRND